MMADVTYDGRAASTASMSNSFVSVAHLGRGEDTLLPMAEVTQQPPISAARNMGHPINTMNQVHGNLVAAIYMPMKAVGARLVWSLLEPILALGACCTMSTTSNCSQCMNPSKQ